MRWIRRAWGWMRERLYRLVAERCPECGSTDHEHKLWQCAACGAAQPEEPVMGRCEQCPCRHLDSVRQCNSCGRSWNPRFVAMGKARS
mgnify:CR=1 FL=1